MTKTIFKIISIFTLFIVSIGCEPNDDSLLEISDEKSVELSTKYDTKRNVEIENTNLWRIVSYEGQIVWRNGNLIPFVGTITNTQSTINGVWFATGGFVVEGNANGRNARFKRVSREAGTIGLIHREGSSIIFSHRNFIAMPSDIPSQCIDNTNTLMSGANRVVRAQNYNAIFTYNWKVVNNGNTTNSTGSSVNVPVGNSKVTLTVSSSWCNALSRTQNFNFDSAPTNCPEDKHTRIFEDVFNSSLKALSYNTSYIYNWTITSDRDGSTRYRTGSSVRIRGIGEYKVTLTVSKNGCASKSRTTDFIVEACPRC